VKTSPTTILASALRAFFGQHLPLTRGLSPKTILSYRDAFVLLLRFLATRHACQVVELDIVHLGPEDLLAFLEHLESERGNTASTRNARLAAVHAFARFLATGHPECLELCQRLLAIPTKRIRIAPVEYLEGEEIGAMLEAVDLHQPQGQRDQALLLTLFNTGARVQEILDLRPVDLQLERPYLVRLRGKGRKGRICPLWPKTMHSLRALLASLPDPAHETVPIFRNRRGEPLTRFGVRYILRRYAQRAHVRAPRLASKRVHPHLVRHSTAVYLLRSGVDPVTISHFLGHASVETTNRYATVDLETKRQALERAGPLDQGAEPPLASWRADASILAWLEAL
jgi:site-specific recombinase XerD